MSATRLAQLQPKPGDVWLHCGHISGGVHIGRADRRFVRPDGSRGYAQWLGACEPCFIAAGGDFDRVPIRGDFVDTGTPLRVKAPE